MASISWSKTVTSSTGGTYVFSGSVQLSVSVSGEKITYELKKLYGTINGIPAVMYAQVGCSSYKNWTPGIPHSEDEQTQIVYWTGTDTISGTFTATSEEGTIWAYIYPENYYEYASAETPAIISEAFAGARINHTPSARIGIPASVYAGSTITVVCTMGDADGDSVRGVLYRHYKAPNAQSFSKTVINNNLTAETTNVYETIPDGWGGGQLRYELVVSDASSSRDVYSETRRILANSAPTTPPSLTIPSAIAHNSTIAIEWEASTDADGNLAGYILERSTDSGSTWTQVYMGEALSTNDFIPAGTTTVRYRVKAYDTYQAESAWRFAPASGDKSVAVNNSPTTPAAPITITPSSLSTGTAAVITWGESTDPDGDAFSYELYRQADSGSWSKIYTGTNRTYTDTIGSWGTVRYRVKAVDVHGASSGWRTSNTRTVSSNAMPTLSVTNNGSTLADGASIGTQNTEFSTVKYTPNDTDSSDTITVREIVDGIVKRTVTGATKNAEVTFNFRTDPSDASTSYWNKLLNGEHTVTFSVSDGKATVSQSFKFTKSVGTCTIELKTPIYTTPGKVVDVAVISISGDHLELTVKNVEVSADGGTTWEQCCYQSASVEFDTDGRVSTSETNMIENAGLIGENKIFIKKLDANGSQFKFRVTAEAVNVPGMMTIHGHISSIQGAFTQRDAEV